MTIITVYEPNDRASKYKKQKLTVLKEEVDNSIITVVKISIPLSGNNRSTGKNNQYRCSEHYQSPSST